MGKCGGYEKGVEENGTHKQEVAVGTISADHPRTDRYERHTAYGSYLGYGVGQNPRCPEPAHARELTLSDTDIPL